MPLEIIGVELTTTIRERSGIRRVLGEFVLFDTVYDQPVAHLADLPDLAQYQGEQAAFQAHLNEIYRNYHNRSALIRRLYRAKLFLKKIAEEIKNV